VQLIDALAHASDPHARRHLGESVGKNLGESNAVIGDFYQHGIRVAFDAHAGGSGSGMAVHVGERLLDHAKNRKLQSLLGTWIDWDDLHSVLTQTDGSNDLLVAENGTETSAQSNPAKSRPFCVIELPVELNVPRCTAVLSDGVIAIRMPKLERKSPIQS
jgi:hypothetical protein